MHRPNDAHLQRSVPGKRWPLTLQKHCPPSLHPPRHTHPPPPAKADKPPPLGGHRQAPPPSPADQRCPGAPSQGPRRRRDLGTAQPRPLTWSRGPAPSPPNTRLRPRGPPVPQLLPLKPGTGLRPAPSRRLGPRLGRGLPGLLTTTTTVRAAPAQARRCGERPGVQGWPRSPFLPPSSAGLTFVLQVHQHQQEGEH